MKVYAPGKLILSGEHAVVYGRPALAMAVNRFVTATITTARSKEVHFDLSDLAHRSRLSVSALRDLKDKVKHKYHRFIRGEYTIRQVLQKPFELAQIALGIVTDSMNLTLPHGVKLQLQSDIPMGCGMGSSAATIICVMHAAANYLKIPLSPETLFQLALEAENLQHGHSSGLDLRVVIQGGCLYLYEKQIYTRTVPQLPMYLVSTGTPVTSTGECVEKVAPHFRSNQLGDDFAAVTNAMDVALQQAAWQEIQHAIRLNHRLLVRIGVVPEKTQRFIADVEAMGSAAKICGAGAVAGDNAGAVWVMTDDQSALTALCKQFNYEVISISGEKRGVYAV